MKSSNISDLFQLVCQGDLILLSTMSSGTGREERAPGVQEGEECGTASGGHCLAVGMSASCLGKANL